MSTRRVGIAVIAAAMTFGVVGLAVNGSGVVVADVHHPTCPGVVVDIDPGEPTPIAGTVYVKAGDEHYNVGFQAAGYVAGPQGGHDVSHVDVCPPPPATTTTTQPASTTTTTENPCPDPPCIPNTNVNTTTTTEAGPTTTATGATTTTGVTTTLSPPTSSATTTTSSGPSTSSTTTTLPESFTFGAAGTVCVAEVPTIRITFQTPGFPSLAGQVGELTMTDVNGDVVDVVEVVYTPGATVDILYPGTAVNPDGSIDDVPGWILNDDGFWIIDPTDAYLREGITLTYTVNPTAGPVTITYPPESEACANPDGPFPPGVTPPPPGTPGQLPPTL